MCWGGGGPLVPDCRAVREQRQSVTTDNTNVSLEAVIRLFMCWGAGGGGGGSGSRLQGSKGAEAECHY